MWELAKEQGLEEKEPLLDKLMDHGRAVDINVSVHVNYCALCEFVLRFIGVSNFLPSRCIQCRKR